MYQRGGLGKTGSGAFGLGRRFQHMESSFHDVGQIGQLLLHVRRALTFGCLSNQGGYVNSNEGAYAALYTGPVGR